MSDFNEADHPRDHGKFASKLASAPERSLTASVGASEHPAVAEAQARGAIKDALWAVHLTTFNGSKTPHTPDEAKAEMRTILSALSDEDFETHYTAITKPYDNITRIEAFIETEGYMELQELPEELVTIDVNDWASETGNCGLLQNDPKYAFEDYAERLRDDNVGAAIDARAAAAKAELQAQRSFDTAA